MSKQDLEKYWDDRNDNWEATCSPGAANTARVMAFIARKTQAGRDLEAQDPVALDVAQLAERVALMEGVGIEFAWRLSMRLYDTVSAARASVKISDREIDHQPDTKRMN